MRALRKVRASSAVQISVACAALGAGTLAIANDGTQHARSASESSTSTAAAPVTGSLAAVDAESVSFIKGKNGGPALAASAKLATRKRATRHHARRKHHNVQLAPAVASWYYDQGSTACGFHAHYGVANKTLPCGTKVEIRYGSRTVTATVDDRGPYVAGRSFDLDQTTAGALGMSGVETVLVGR